MRKSVLITGGAGFIGHHLVEKIVNATDWRVTILDRLDFSGNLNRLAELELPRNRVRFVYHDLKAPLNDQLCAQIGAHDYILHLAAATHVDRSIACPMEFVQDNVVATCNLLDFARKTGCERLLYFSTDEVFGPAPEFVAYKEWDRYRSGNPYAATKAGAEELALAYHNTYGVPVIVTHTMNVIGRRQHPEKFLPSTVVKVSRNELVTIHANRSRTKAGSRFYIHADHVADAVIFVTQNGESGDKYNIVGARETSNLRLAEMIADALCKPLLHELVDFHSSRPGHDLRYALDGSKMKEMGWSAPDDLEAQIGAIVQWTLANPRWLL